MNEIKILKFSDLDVSKFLEYLTTCDIQEIQIIDFTPEKLKCKAHPEDKSFIKYSVTDVSGLLKYDTLPNDFKLLKFPFHRLKKTKDVLTIYIKRGIEKINGEIGYTKEDDGSLVGTHIKFISPKLKVRISATEMFLAKHMEDKHWEAYSAKDNPLVKFDLDKDFVNQINNLCGLEGDDNTESKEKDISVVLNILKSENKVVFRSKDKGKWDTECDGNLNITCDKNYSFYIPQKILKAMTASLYDTYVVWNKNIDQHIMIMYENEDNIMLKALVEFNEDSSDNK